MESYCLAKFEIASEEHFVRYKISRCDGQPIAAPCIYERVMDASSGKVKFTFAMLTVNASEHTLFKQFHRPLDEKRSIVELQESDYLKWLNANHDDANQLLKPPLENFLRSDLF